jgi:hypothetical protein
MSSRGIASFLLLTLTLAAPLAAQSLLLVEAPGPQPVFTEFTGPPALPCLYPNGPQLQVHPYSINGPCPKLTPIGGSPSILGDIAVNRVLDQVYIADGKRIGVFDASSGVQLNVMDLATLAMGNTTGLGYDAATNRLWITDGGTVTAATPSAAGSCLSPTPVLSWPSTIGTLTDLSWHPGTGLLWVCTAGGSIAAYTSAGALALAPYAAGVSCPLPMQLKGLEADPSTGCGGLLPRLFVSDGMRINHELAGTGTAAPPSFAFPTNCLVLGFAQQTAGLAYSARAITYGAGTGPTLGTAGGQTVLPNPAFTLTLAGGPPGGQAWLVVGTGAACPPLNFFGNPWYVNPFITTFGPFTLPASGALSLPAPLTGPAGPLPCGTTVFMQWVCRSTSFAWTSSAGLEFTASLP